MTDTVGLPCGCRVRPTTAAEQEAMPFTTYNWAVYAACEQHPLRVGKYESDGEVKDAQRRAWLLSLKPGDMVGVSSSYGLTRSRVAAITPTQIVVSGIPLQRYDRKTGRRKGENTSRFSRPHLEPWLPKNDEALLRDKLRAHLRYFEWGSLTFEQLATVHAALPDAKQLKLEDRND